MAGAEEGDIRLFELSEEVGVFQHIPFCSLCKGLFKPNHIKFDWIELLSYLALDVNTSCSNGYGE